MRLLKLTIELVPSSSWQNNLRGLLPPSVWSEIRKKVIKRNNFKCAICGRSGKLHAHEVWKYDDKHHIQKLEDIIPLCIMCHMVKHIGLSGLINTAGYNDKLIKHFIKVNDCTRPDFQNHLKSETEKFNNRSKYEWQLDLGKLKDFEK